MRGMLAEQAGRRCPALMQQRGVRCCFGFVLQVIEDLLDHHWVFDAGNDLHCAATLFMIQLEIVFTPSLLQPQITVTTNQLKNKEKIKKHLDII